MACPTGCKLCRPFPEKEGIKKPLPDDFTPETEYFYDKKEDVKIFSDILNVAGGPMTLQQQFEFGSLPWRDMIELPLTIPLPCVLVYEPLKNADALPAGKLWAILMTFRVTGTKARPRPDGVVFVCGDQLQPPPNLAMTAMWEWAMDEKNCPETLRFGALSLALRRICGDEDSVYRVKSSRKDGYFPGTKCWKVLEWDWTIDELFKGSIPFVDFPEPLPIAVGIQINKKPIRKRKKPTNEDPERFMQEFDWTKMDLVSLLD